MAFARHLAPSFDSSALGAPECTFERTGRGGLAVLRVDPSWELREAGYTEELVYLVVGPPWDFTIVGELGAAFNPGVGHHHESLDVIRTSRRPHGLGAIVTVEVRTLIFDEDPGVSALSRRVHRSLLVCLSNGALVDLACDLTVPLEVVKEAVWVPEAGQDVDVLAREPGVSIRRSRQGVTQLAHRWRSSATAVIRSDGTVQLRLRHGSWEELYPNSEEEVPGTPDGHLLTLPIVSRDEAAAVSSPVDEFLLSSQPSEP